MATAKQPKGVDEWKMEQLRNLRDSGFAPEEIADQVDLDIVIVREVLRLMD